MKLSELCAWLDSEAPLSFQESYDNSGLQIGEPGREITSALLTVDVTEKVVEEAIAGKFSIIISHHPLLFAPVKKISGSNPTGRIISKCIKHDIAVYSAHTSLDIAHHMVSSKMAEKLGLYDNKVLKPQEKKLMKLVTYIPESHLEKVRNAIFDAGAGVVGNYDRCGFGVQGTGSFRGNEDTDPFVGEPGKMHFGDEVRFETVMFTHMRDRVVEALLANHPYEEVAYDLYSLENRNIDSGLGCIGTFREEMEEMKFLKLVSEVFGARGVRYSDLTGRKVKKVAVCGGSGASLIRDAVQQGADAFVTAEIKYHAFFEAENRILLVDAGHYESEKYSVEVLKELIIKKFPKFALRFSETNTNPINYL